jgi:hypothetical protein
VRDLKDFTKGEWIRLLPLKLGFKQVRNDVIQRAILMQRPKALEKFLEDMAYLKGRNIAQVVAFGQPLVLDFFLKAAGRHLADATVLVFDNSRRTSERAEIERVCRNHNIHYLSLPWNPTRHANRSHGVAMTWIFHNIVRAIQPAITSFLDHDMILTERIEFAKVLGNQPFYGMPIISQWAWSLWAGYCIYDFAAVSALPLNFLYDFSRGLDTGGRNWNCLYKNQDRGRLAFADSHLVDVIDPATDVPRQIQCVDGRWIHLGGVSYNNKFRLNADFYARIADALNEGANFRQVLATMKPLP